MHFKGFIAAGFLSIATLVNADFEIDTTWDYGTATHSSKWYSSKNKAISSALSTYSAHLTTQSQYASAYNGVYSYLSTAKGIPEIVTATDSKTTYTSVPTWYTGLPKDIQSYISSVGKAEASIVSSVVHNAAPQPTPCAGYKRVAGAAAVGAVGAGALLF